MIACQIFGLPNGRCVLKPTMIGSDPASRFASRQPVQKSAGADPFVFGADLIGQRFLELIGKDSPGVGFDFEVRTGLGMFLEVGERGFGVIEGRGEGRKGFGVKWNVEMDPAFGRCGDAVEVGKIFEAGEWIGVENNLVEIGRFVKLTDGFEGLGVLRVEGKGV